MDGFILAGGKSTRMGQPKSEMSLGGKLFLNMIADAMAPITGDRAIYVVGGDLAAPQPLRSLADPELEMDGVRPGGPLVGLYAALHAATSEWIVVSACDLPLVTGQLFVRLARQERTEFDAVVPVQPDGRPQPLCALYRRTPCLPAVLDAIRSGDGSLRWLLRQIRTRLVPFSEFASLEHARRLLTNVNTPEEYRSVVEESGP